MIEYIYFLGAGSTLWAVLLIECDQWKNDGVTRPAVLRTPLDVLEDIALWPLWWLQLLARFIGKRFF